MPRRMPRFDRDLYTQAQLATEVVRAGEIAHASGEPSVRREWTIAKLEALHELAYLRAFAAWEACLEAIFYRSLCGYASAAGQEVLLRGRYYTSLSDAEAAVLGSNSYVLWHNPQRVINRCNAFINSGPGCPTLMATVITSSFTRLEQLSCIRHRIVHDQADAKRKFDSATKQLTGRAYPGSRPGKFLRDWCKSGPPPKRWLEVVIGDLTSLVGQIV